MGLAVFTWAESSGGGGGWGSSGHSEGPHQRHLPLIPLTTAPAPHRLINCCPAVLSRDGGGMGRWCAAALSSSSWSVASFRAFLLRALRYSPITQGQRRQRLVVLHGQRGAQQAMRLLPHPQSFTEMDG